MDHSSTCFDLLGLRNELLLKVIEHKVLHEDLENLIFGFKAIFNLGQRARAKHLKRKRQHSLVEAGDLRIYRGGFERPDLPPLRVHAPVPLQQALEDTAIIDYCRTLRLSGTVVTGD